MVKILIIADDETGMLDTGAQFAKKGIRTEALLHAPLAEELRQSEIPVMVVNARTRHLSARQAYEKVCGITKTAFEAGVELIYKKTDSALRGHVGEELGAALDAVPGESLYFFPAYPEAGRSTVKGIQYVDGIPVSESAFGRDRLNPVTESYIPAMLKSSGVPVVSAEDPIQWASCAGTPQIVLFDAADRAALKQAVSECFRKCTPRLVAGCAGLAEELAERFRQLGNEGRDMPKADRLFVLCGSIHPVTRSQLDYAQAHGFERFSLTREMLLENDWKSLAEKVQKACDTKKSVIVDVEMFSAEKGKDQGLDRHEMSQKIVDTLNEILIQNMCFLDGYTFFLTGGDTLSAFIRQSGCERITVLGELQPGIALNRFLIEGKERYVISKSGGFGNKDTIIDCLNERQL